MNIEFQVWFTLSVGNSTDLATARCILITQQDFPSGFREQGKYKVKTYSDVHFIHMNIHDMKTDRTTDILPS